MSDEDVALNETNTYEVPPVLELAITNTHVAVEVRVWKGDLQEAKAVAIEMIERGLRVVRGGRS